MDQYGDLFISESFAVIFGNGKNAFFRFIFAACDIEQVGTVVIQGKGDWKSLAQIFRRHMGDQADPFLFLKIIAVCAADVCPCIQDTFLFGMK